MTQPTWDEMPTTDRIEHLRSKLATIRKAWPHLLDPPPPQGTGRRTPPGSRLPTHADALSLRAEITHDLAFWCHALLEDKPDIRDQDDPLDLTDASQTLAHLLANVAWIAGWSFSARFAYEIADHAHDASVIAWPRHRGTILLGECPNTIGADGEVITCGTKVRVVPGHEGDIRCRGCRKVETLEGWLMLMVGTEQPVAIPQLRVILHQRLGIAVDERTLRRWYNADRIPSCGGTPGKPLFDRRAVMTALMQREDIRRWHALTGS